MTENKKLAFVVTSMGRGGAERVVSILSNYYANIGWDVTIIMLWHNKVGYALDEKIKILNLSDDKKSFKKQLGTVLFKLIKQLKEIKPDVVVSFIAENCPVADIACKLAKVRHITSERIDPGAVKRNMVIQKAINFFYKRCDCVVFQTERAKKFYSEKIQRKSVVIGNPVQVSQDVAEIKKNKIVSAGRLEKQKNHKMLISSFAKVCKKYPNYVLEIYGEGKLRAELQEHIKHLNVENNVFLKGNVAGLHQEINDAQIFVLSSNYEGLSNALLEAMMLELACVSTECAGSDEVIVNGENGLLVPVGDENALEKAIVSLIENESLRDKISANGKKSVEKFKTENIINLWAKVIGL